MLRPISRLGLAALAAIGATEAEAAPSALRGAPRNLGAHLQPPANLNCPRCGTVARGTGQFQPGDAAMLNPQPPRHLHLRR